MPQVERGPSKMNRILEEAYQSALAQGHDKSSASKIAWSAAKKQYKKVEDKWVRKRAK